jgi:hypothetical protein
MAGFDALEWRKLIVILRSRISVTGPERVAFLLAECW